MRTKATHLCKKGLALLMAMALCISLLPGMAMTAEAKKTPSKTVKTTFYFYNHTGKRITEFYFEDSSADDYGDEYLSQRGFKYWSNNKYIKVTLKYKKKAKADFYVRYSDGTGYEAKGLSLAKAKVVSSSMSAKKAKTSGNIIDLTKSKVSLKVKNKTVASAKFKQTEMGVPAVTGVTLNKTSATLMEGQTTTLTATVSPTGANKSVTWSSSNSSVASVSSTGKVTAKKAGTATITAKTADGGYKATCTVTVTKKKVTGVTLNKTSATITKGSTTTLTATVSPTGANKSVIWSTSDSSVATVSSTGKVTAKKAGTAKITATTVEGGYTATCQIAVTEKTVTGVKLNRTSLSLDVGGTSTLTATISPSGASNSVTWSSSDPSVATVSSTGKVTAVKAGTATIMVKTASGGYVAACTVTVTAKTYSFTIYFWNKTGKQIDELYFTETGDTSWDTEYLSTYGARYWTNGKAIPVSLKFTSDACIDFRIRYNDGSVYEARGLSLANVKSTNYKIELTASEVKVVGSNTSTIYATAAFVQKEASTAISDADWTNLQKTWNALKDAYNAVVDLYSLDQIKADKDINAAMEEAKKLIDQMGTIKRDGLTTADGQTLAKAMVDTANALELIVKSMEVKPTTRTINVKFINGTTANFTNFTAKPVGGTTGSDAVTLESGKTQTLKFTVEDTAGAFEITFTESINNQPYTMTVSFDSSVKDGDTLTVEYSVKDGSQDIIWDQI